MRIDPRYFRPTEAELLLADPGKAKTKLRWEPKVTFEELVRIMMDADMEAVGLTPLGGGRAALTRHGLNASDRALLSNTLGGME